MMRDSFREWARKRAYRQEMRETGGTPTSASFHRRAYHRNFQGYTEVKRLRPDGRTVIERVYTGHWYEPMLSMERRVRLRILYVLLFLCGAGVFGWAATRRAVCNTVLYVGLFQALAVAMAIWCLYVLVFYIPATGKLTIGEYDTLHKPLIRSAMACAVCLWAAAAAAVVCLVLDRAAAVGRDWLCPAGFALSGALFGLIWFLESRLEYAVLDNETPMPEDGVEIDV